VSRLRRRRKWLYRNYENGRVENITIGTVEDMTYAQARERADALALVPFPAMQIKRQRERALGRLLRSSAHEYDRRMPASFGSGD
jgi:hypothetical protein